MPVAPFAAKASGGGYLLSPQSTLTPTWTLSPSPRTQATTFNMGSCFRKLRDYTNAIKYYERALALAPSNASTYTALGFSYHLIGDLDIAISYYHKVGAVAGRTRDTAARQRICTCTLIHTLAHKRTRTYTRANTLSHTSAHVQARLRTHTRTNTHNPHSRTHAQTHTTHTHNLAMCQALGLKPEDTLASEMLSKALQETFSEASVARTGLLEKRPTALHNAAVWAD